MMFVRIENGKPTVRWGRKARGLSNETAQLPKPGPAHETAVATSQEQAAGGGGFTGATATAIALALPGQGTPPARIDPNRYGLRTVDAAGGSTTTVVVRFTVRSRIAVLRAAGSTAGSQRRAELVRSRSGSDALHALNHHHHRPTTGPHAVRRIG